MADTTDKGESQPMSEDAAVDWLLSPEQSEEPEAEAEEAPAEPTDTEEPEAEADAPVEAEEHDDDEEDGDEPEASDEDEDEDPEPEDDEQPEQRHTVKVDGQEIEVTLDELKRGYSGQAYIQKGMEEAKAYQRQLTEAAQAMQQEREALIQMYQKAQETGFAPEPQAPDVSMLQSDPIAYMEADAKYRQDLQAYQQQQKQIQAAQEQEKRYQDAMRQNELAQQLDILRQRIPEFGDAEKAPELQKKLMRGAEREYGISEQELSTIMDARAIHVLNDAIAYRELQAGKQAAKKPRQEAKAVTKPSGKRRDGKRAQAQKQLQKARQTQSDTDWVDFLLTPKS